MQKFRLSLGKLQKYLFFVWVKYGLVANIFQNHSLCFVIGSEKE